MKRIHNKTLGIYSHLWGYHLNTFSGTRLVGSRLTSMTPSVDTSNKFRSFYSPSSNLFSSQILPSSSTERVPSTSTSTTTGTTEAAESRTSSSTATSGANNLTSTENMVSEETLADTLPPKNSPYTKDRTDPVDYVGTQLFIAKDCEALLAVYNNKKGVRMNIRHVCQAVCSLGERVKNSQSPEEADSLINVVVNDDRFKKMCLDLQAAQFEEIPHLLLIAIQGLSNLGLSESMVMKTLENEVKWVVRRCPVKVVAKAVGTLTTSGAGSGEASVIKTSTTKLDSNHPLVVCVYALQRRWVEVTAGSDFIAVFQVISYLSDETKAKLEDRAVELVQGFTAMEIVKIFIGLGSNKRRPTPLLRALAFHLAKSPENIPPKDIIELIYALNALSFCDPLLMARLCNDLIPGISSVINSAVISSVVTSLGQLRYKNTELLGALEDWILNHLDELRPFDSAAWILTCSVLNLNSNPENLTLVCNKAKEFLEPTKLDNPIRWVNIVHALAVLNQVDSSILSTALEPSFVAQLDALGDKKNLIGVNCKLLNLNALSKTLKDYKGHYLSNDLVAKWTPGVQVRSDANLSKSAFEALSNFLPPPKYLLGSQLLPSGVFVDAVCKLNSKLDPIPLDSQEGVTVAVLTQGYPAMTLGLIEPTGVSCFNVRLLQNEGYTVVTVPYNEFNPQEKLLRKVQYLEQRVRSIQLPQKSASSSSASQSVSNSSSSSSKDNINKTQGSER